VATCLSFGQYHGAVVVNDISTNSDFIELPYAKQILADFKAYLLRRWNLIQANKKQGSSDGVKESPDMIIELTVKDCFKS